MKSEAVACTLVALFSQYSVCVGQAELKAVTAGRKRAAIRFFRKKSVINRIVKRESFKAV